MYKNDWKSKIILILWIQIKLHIMNRFVKKISTFLNEKKKTWNKFEKKPYDYKTEKGKIYKSYYILYTENLLRIVYLKKTIFRLFEIQYTHQYNLLSQPTGWLIHHRQARTTEAISLKIGQ